METSIEHLHSDIIARALGHMDGPTLAAASCSASLLRVLASDPALWRDLCLSTWPSLRHPRLLSLLSGAHRSFFADSFPFPAATDNGEEAERRRPSEAKSPPEDEIHGLPARLISAVDLYHKGAPVFSRVIETDASSSWFLASPLRVDGLDRKDPDQPSQPTAADEPAINPADLSLSWAFIAPETGRAVNVSSRRPVSIDRHWYSGETLVRFAVVLQGCTVNVVVTCGEEAGHVREVTMTIEDQDGAAVSGRESLRLLTAAMEGGRRGAKWEEEVKQEYAEYVRMKRERRERKARREGILDLCCTGFGALMFLSFIMLLAFR